MTASWRRQYAASIPKCREFGMHAFCNHLLALVIAFGIWAALPVAAHAGPYEDALARFVTNDFDDTTEAINGLAASGHPLAATTIDALQVGRLFFTAEARK